MYEPWVLDIDLSTIEENSSDPDFPNVGKLTKYSTKSAWTGVAMIHVIQSKELCIQGFWADYLNDESATGEQAKFSFSSFLYIVLTMTYQHLSAPYKLAVTDHHKFWQDKCDLV